MADLYIDGAVFARMQANLAHIGDLLERPGRELAMLDESCVGAAALRARTAEFGEEWSYGIGQLSKFSQDASEALAQIDAAFREVEAQLTRALGPGAAVRVTMSIGGTGASGPRRTFGPGPACRATMARAGNFPALGFDPTPGDRDAVDLVVGTLRHASRALDETATVLRGAGARASRSGLPRFDGRRVAPSR